MFFWLCLVAFFVVVVPYLNYKHRENRKTAWQRLAEAHHLDFLPGNLLGGGAYVTGSFRGHSLKLETIQKSHGKSSVTYTSLTLYRKRTGFFDRSHEGDNEPASTIQQLVSAGSSYALRGEISATPEGRQLSYEQRGLETDTKYLQFLFELLSDLSEAYRSILALGGEAVPALLPVIHNQRSALRPLTIQLLQDIGGRTRYRFSHRLAQLLCPTCFRRFGEHKVRLVWWSSVTYYGCRTCGQSRKFLEVAEGKVVATLDHTIPLAYYEREQKLCVNWLARRQMFDFEAVEIIQATDEEVERLAVQVGNDTDDFSRPRYQHMPCRISAACKLSENTLRILQRTFGPVTIEDLGGSSEPIEMV